MSMEGSSLDVWMNLGKETEIKVVSVCRGWGKSNASHDLPRGAEVKGSNKLQYYRDSGLWERGGYG